MRHLEKMNTAFLLVVIVGTICITATALQRYIIFSLLITAIGVTGFVVTDCCIRLIERDLRELLRKAKNEGC